MKKSKIRVVLLFFLSAMLIFLPGCSEEYTQLHEKLIVQAIGIDRTRENNYLVTIQALDFKNLEEKEKPTVKVLQISGSTVMEAMGNIVFQTGLQPLYSQNLMLIVGKETAEQGIDKLVDFFIHHYEMRPNIKVCLSEGSAFEILNLEINGKILEAKNIFDTINKDIKSDMIHFVGDIEHKTSDPYVPCFRLEKGGVNPKIVTDNIAIFDGNKLSRILDNTTSQGVLLINGVSNIGVYVVKGLEYFGDTAFELTKVSTKIDVNIYDNLPSYSVNMKVNAHTFEIDKNLFDGGSENMKSFLETKLAEKLKEISQQAFITCIQNRSDVFGLGKKLLRKYPDYFKYASDNWKENIKTYPFNIEVQTEISDIGIFS